MDAPALPPAAQHAPALDAAATAARDAIWAKEQKIYHDRGTGNFDAYISNSSPDYLGWPPNSPLPQRTDGLQQTKQQLARENKEQLTMELVDFALHGDTAVIYYRTHRTRRPDGTPTSEIFETIHVWVRSGTDWKVFGAMARLEPQRKP